MADGVFIRGRLVKVEEPRSYTGRDGVERQSKPALVLLTGGATERIEYRSAVEREEALIGAGIASADLEIDADGTVADLPRVEVAVVGFGGFDQATGRSARARYVGA